VAGIEPLGIDRIVNADFASLASTTDADEDLALVAGRGLARQELEARMVAEQHFFSASITNVPTLSLSGRQPS